MIDHPGIAVADIARQRRAWRGRFADCVKQIGKLPGRKNVSVPHAADL
jgi:hypothetical protein